MPFGRQNSVGVSVRSKADSTASASHPFRNASRIARDRAARAARSGPYQCQLCPRPPPRPFALIPARFCDCVPATTCGRPAMLVVALTQIGLSHTSWIANSESVNGRPSSSINAYRCGRTTRCRPSRINQNLPYPSSEILPVQKWQSRSPGPRTMNRSKRSRSGSPSAGSVRTSAIRTNP